MFIEEYPELVTQSFVAGSGDSVEIRSRKYNTIAGPRKSYRVFLNGESVGCETYNPNEAYEIARTHGWRDVENQEADYR